MNDSIRKALRKAHAPASRRKAAATLVRLGHLRDDLAKQHGVRPSAFLSTNIVATMKRHAIPPSAIPVDLFHPLPAKLRNRLIKKHTNGHGANGHDHGADRSVGIPLHAVPERAPSAYMRGKAHPNAELILKTLDLLANPEIPDKVAQRLVAALDKLLTG